MELFIGRLWLFIDRPEFLLRCLHFYVRGAGLGSHSFDVALIPHTLRSTTLGELTMGDTLHYEIDVLAKYVHQALVAGGRLGS